MTEFQGWIAVFEDGPMAVDTETRHFTGSLPPELYFAPIPRPRDSGPQWMLVGAGFPERGGWGPTPEEPWDGQVKYVAADEIEPRPVDEPQTVKFRLESDS